LEASIGPGSHILGRGTELHAVIGNSMMNAAIRYDGNMHRLFWPTVGYPQHIKDSYAGIYCEYNEKKIFSWLTEEEWVKVMEYLGDTNVLTITYVNEKLGLMIRETAFVDYLVSLLVRRFEITSLNMDMNNVSLYYYQAPALGENLYGDATITDESTNVVIQYYRSYYLGLGFEDTEQECVCGVCEEEDRCAAKIENGEIAGPKVAISIGRLGIYSLLKTNLGFLRRNATKSATVLISASKSDYHSISLIAWARSVGYERLLDRTMKYWRRVVASTRNYGIEDGKVLSLFNRSVLVLKLLSDRRHGGIIAAPTLDPDYRYVWIRDATYMAAALDIVGRHREAEKFYMWCTRAQTPEGGFKQRYFPDPRYPGPYWSDQLDQFSIIIWGCKLHYDLTGDRGFLFRTWPMVSRIADYLMHVIDSDGRVVRSGDIWEEGNVRHIYTASSVCSAMRDAHTIAKILNKEDEKTYAWFNKYKLVRENVLTEFWNEKLGRFVKRVEPYSEALDISALSLSTPFKILPAGDERMVRTAEAMLRKLSFPIGGIGRFENDPNYGGNPWPISTLWMSIYLAKLGRAEEARSLHRWVVEHANELNLLPEQIDKNNGEPLSALPLGWSHAMYIMATSTLYGNAGDYL